MDDLDQDVIECYMKNWYEDPHEEFAKRRGASRQEAKKMIYTYLYSSNFFRGLMDSLDGEV